MAFDQCCQMAVMTAPWRGGFLKKRHQIAMALRVSNGSLHRFNNGGGMAIKKLFFKKKFPK